MNERKKGKKQVRRGAKFLHKIFMCVFSDFEWRNKQHRNHNNIHYSCFRCCATVTKIQLSPGSTIVIDMYVFVSYSSSAAMVALVLPLVLIQVGGKNKQARSVQKGEL